MRYLFLFLSLMIFGCNTSTDPDPAYNGEDFFPLETGRFAEYEITEIQYPINQAPVTRNYFLRQEIADAFVNQTGGTTYVIYRYVRNNSSENWRFETTWNARKEINRIVISEGNIPYIKLSLPVRNAITWNGNALNTFEEDLYVSTDLDTEETLNDGSIVRSVLVVQEDFDDLVIGERDIRTEKYARNIGLIERTIIQQDLCSSLDCPGEEVIRSGFSYHEKIIGYGITN